MNNALILDSKEIEQIIQFYGLNYIMDEIIKKTETEIFNYSDDNIKIPKRDGFNYTSPEIGLVEWMPVYQTGKEVTIKLVGYHPQNPNKYNVPTVMSTISQYNTTTGQLNGVIDGVLSTALRTGAASAIATKYLANKDQCETIGLIGCGVQSITQLHAISRLFDIKKVLYYDIDADINNSFAERAEFLRLDADFKKSTIDEIAAQSDIICTATSIGIGEGPLFEAIEPKEHLHINAVGSDFPGKVEVPMDILTRSFICPDFVEQALVEGECQLLGEERIDADLKELVKHPETYEAFKSKLSVFDSTGWALEDHVTFNIFMECAKTLGIGKEFSVEADPINPYNFLEPVALEMEG